MIVWVIVSPAKSLNGAACALKASQFTPTATLVPDALPEVTLTGSVNTIDDFFVEKRGDVTYTANILVDGIDPRVRWGMTVVVTFEE